MTTEQTAERVDEPTATAPDRRTIIMLTIGAAVLVAVGAGYLLFAQNRVQDDLATRGERAQAAVDDFVAEQQNSGVTVPVDAPASEDEAVAAQGPVPVEGEVVFVNRVPGDDYGRLGIRHIDGSRTLLDRKCLRVHVAAGNGLCLSEDDGVLPTFSTTFFEADTPEQTIIKTYKSTLPSRARVSPDGSFVSTTGFLTGTSYEDIAGETTTVVILDRFDGTEITGLDQYGVDSDDPRYSTGNRKFWGVSFEDNDRFYVTGLYGDEPEILLGNRPENLLEPTGWVGSCPSLSPDAKTLVFKELRDDGGFDLVAIDLESGERQLLNETRSVDDQVEWLDNDTILYALHPDGEADEGLQPQFDIWSLDLAPGAEPVKFLPAADSPAVIRN